MNWYRLEKVSRQAMEPLGLPVMARRDTESPLFTYVSTDDVVAGIALRCHQGDVVVGAVITRGEESLTTIPDMVVDGSEKAVMVAIREQGRILLESVESLL